MNDKIGILFSSYGDIDSFDELEAYFKRSFNSFLPPLPWPLKPLLVELVWCLRKNQLKKEYESFGVNTDYRGHSRQQADKIQQNLLNVHELETTTYIDFNFATPYIPTTLKSVQAAGVTQLLVVNQGAAYSTETTQKDFDEVVAYLDRHREWPVKAIGLKSFARDDRFINLLGEKIKNCIDTEFEGVSVADLCIFLPIHGVPCKAVEQGDPYLNETNYIVDRLQKRFSEYTLQKGYQNHQFGKIKWTQPPADVVAEGIGRGVWKNVLMDGQISFTIDCGETLGEERIELANAIVEAAQGIGKEMEKVFVKYMFNDDDRFAEVMAQILADVLRGEGDPDIVELN